MGIIAHFCLQTIIVMCYNINIYGQCAINLEKNKGRNLMLKQQKFEFVCVDEFKRFIVNGKIGIKKWDDSLVLSPICIETPNLYELEDLRYTFIHIEEGWTLINQRGKQLLPLAKEMGWFCDSSNLIVVFIDSEDGTSGLYFIKTGETINGIDDATMEPNFIKTYHSSNVGMVLYDGRQIFEPNYKEVAIFEKEFFIAYDENGRASLTHPKWKRCINDLMYFKIIKRKHWTDEAILVQYSNGDFQWFDCGSGEELEENRELASLRKLAENDIKHNRIGKHL